jgi:hypothetical protein
VHLADLLMADLGPDTDRLMPHLQQFDAGIANGPSVFGGVDASGYATRISVLIGCSTASLCPQGGAGIPVSAPAGAASAGPGGPPPSASGGGASGAAGGATALAGQDAGLNAIADLLLGRPRP